jgi:hypothetical protein
MTLANPFPGGFLQPSGSSAGLATNLGNSISLFPEDTTSSYMQRWQLAVQRQLVSDTVLELSYVGNRGTRMRVGRDLNPVPAQYLSTSPFRDQAAIDFLAVAVTNPFAGLLPKTTMNNPTIGRSQLLRPYPQYSGLSSTENIGYAWYHSMQVRVDKRFSRGLNATLSYTWSKTMEATSFLNATDTRLEEVISSQDRTHRLAVIWMYELPFGKGKHFLGSNNLVDKVVGGWQVQGIYTAQSGAALGFGNAIFLGDLHNIPLPKDQRYVNKWFNIDAGFNRVTSQQLGSNIRTFPSRFSGIRADGPNNWDLSVIKNTILSDRAQLQFRAEAINALNHPQFTAPNTTPTSTAFGTVTGEFAWPRVIQFGLKLVF